jgi:hypothetical protein
VYPITINLGNRRDLNPYWNFLTKSPSKKKKKKEKAGKQEAALRADLQ